MPALTQTVPAPLGGLNARDPIAAMPPMDAVEMENWFPDTASVITRLGHEVFADGTALYSNATPGATYGFQQLLVWSHGQTASKLFAVMTRNLNGTPRGQWDIYEVSTLGVLTLSTSITASLLTDSEAPGEATMFVTGSGTPYLVLRVTDGTADFTRAYDGTAWSSPAISGLPAVGATGLNAHRNRLWFYGFGLTAYYLPLSAIAGTVASFNLGTLFSKGGRIVSMRTWTTDNGQGGSDDLAVFLTDNGQAAIFSGTDPASASTWQLVGVFDVGMAASGGFGVSIYTANRGSSYMLKLGADLLAVLADGVTSMAKVLGAGPADAAQDYTISTKINSLVRDAAATYGAGAAGSVNAWALTFDSRTKQLILNIPTANSPNVSSASRCTSFQYVMNTLTGAWAKFTGMSYLDAVIWRGDLYMVAGGYNVYRYGQVNADLGASITAVARQAPNYLGDANTKLLTVAKPTIRADGNFALCFRCGVEFTKDGSYTTRSYTPSGSTVIKDIWSPAKEGEAVSAELEAVTSAGRVEWISTGWAWTPGGIL